MNNTIKQQTFPLNLWYECSDYAFYERENHFSIYLCRRSDTRVDRCDKEIEKSDSVVFDTSFREREFGHYDLVDMVTAERCDAASRKSATHRVWGVNLYG